MGMPALPDQQLTLKYLSTWAEENHPVLRRDRARVVSADGSAIQAGLYPNPRFDTNNFPLGAAARPVGNVLPG